MDLEKYMLPCTNKAITGVECLGCGMQRSIAMIVNGDFSGAFTMYPPIYSFLLFVGSLCLFLFYKKKPVQHLVISSAIFYALFAVVAYVYKQSILFNLL